MPQFGDFQVSAFLDALASPSPTPGGGTASAMAGAIGASLLMMAAGLSRTRTGTDAERIALAQARAELSRVRDRFVALGDLDADAYDRVIAAYRLPKIAEDDKRLRRDAIEQALQTATTAPLDTMRAAAEAMRVARRVAEHGHRAAASDIGAGVALLEASAEGASANVRINLENVQDAAFKTSAAAAVEDIAARLRDDASAARALLKG